MKNKLLVLQNFPRHKSVKEEDVFTTDEQGSEGMMKTGSE